jgi:CubicO group peptidase (beta-lactamase class C family)
MLRGLLVLALAAASLAPAAAEDIQNGGNVISEQEKSSTADPPCPFQPIAVDYAALFQDGKPPKNVAIALQKVADIVSSAVSNSTLGSTCVSAGLSYAGNNQVWYYSFGDATKSGGKPSRGTLFRIGSVSKLFPATMLYHLAEPISARSDDSQVQNMQERPLVSLDATVQATVPSFKGLKDPFSRSKSRQPTWRQICSQVAGLPREAPCDVLPKTGFSCNLTTDEIFARLEKET